MPVDPTALINAILDGLAKVPPGLFAAIILGGPTAIWLIVRFGHPPDGRKADPTAMEEFLWVCVWCRSINEDTRDSCYSCHRSRTAQDVPGGAAPGLTPLTGSGTWIGPGVGIAVGPGRLAESQPTGSWLGGEAVGDARTDEDSSGLEREPVAALRADPPPVSVPMRAHASEEEVVPLALEPGVIEPGVVEPVIVEPRVKVSGRRPASPGR
jgi:hypothetical protein